MTHQEAKQKALTVRWKTKTCNAGKACWCRAIVPETKILFDGDTLSYIVGPGLVDKEMAEHIVKIHNKYLEDKP